MAVVGLAVYATKARGLELTSGNIRDNLRTVANPPGDIIKPGEFIKAELNEQMVTAAFEGNTALVMDLLAKGADVNAEGKYSGWTPPDDCG